jgi:hypothetical protein
MCAAAHKENREKLRVIKGHSDDAKMARARARRTEESAGAIICVSLSAVKEVEAKQQAIGCQYILFPSAGRVGGYFIVRFVQRLAFLLTLPAGVV